MARFARIGIQEAYERAAFWALGDSDLCPVPNAEGVRLENLIEDLKVKILEGVARRTGFREIAAGVMKFIVSRQPFRDCNHRTSFLSADAILRIGGFELSVTPEEAAEFILRINSELITEAEVLEWIKRNCALR